MLPQFSKGNDTYPEKLLLFSTTKVGKTTLVSALPNALIIDSEDGSRFVNGIKFNLIRESQKQGISQMKLLRLLAEEIKKANQENGEPIYDFIVFDTITGIEKLAREMATILYKKTLVGKNYNGTDVVADIPSGGGYLFLRKAYDMLLGYFDGLADKSIIYLGHIKLASVLKDGNELSAIDLDLTGKIKSKMSMDVDAIGLLRRDKDDVNKVMVSFKSNSRDLATGSRVPSLRGKEFAISEYDPDKNKFTFHWDKIYPFVGGKK